MSQKNIKTYDAESEYVMYEESGCEGEYVKTADYLKLLSEYEGLLAKLDGQQ